MNGDLGRLATATQRLCGVRSADELAGEVLDVLDSLIGGEVASYNEVPIAGTGPVRVLARPEPAELGGGVLRAFAEHLSENPLLAHHRNTGEVRALRFSDLIGRRQLHALALYQECYRLIEVEYQLAITIPAADRLVGITVSRARRDFSVRERDMLQALRAPLQLVHERLRERAWHAAAICGLEAMSPGLGVLALASDGTIVEATPSARSMLGGELRSDALADWASAQRSTATSGRLGAPQELTLGRRRLQLRFMRGPDDQPDLVVLQEPSPPPSHARLLELGLTPRQAEVLALMADGLTNRQIAVELTLSPHTVDHHVEAVLARLGVSGRLAAVRLALDSGVPEPSPGPTT